MKVTWLGHASFRVEMADAAVLIDPFLKGNGVFESSGVAWDDAVAGATHVVLTHGHDDHIGDTVEICQKTGATLVAVVELAGHLQSKGVEAIEYGNTGGTITSNGARVTFTNALHSSSSGGVYLGNPCGVVVSAADGSGPVVYHMGDTDVFPGMALIQDLYQPTIGLVPVGDRFTMGGKSAAYACKTYFKFDHIVPCHYGTFPIIEPSPDKFVAEMSGYPVRVMSCGETLDA